MLEIKQYFSNKWIIVLFLFILVVSFKLPIINTPHYWDSINRIHNANWVKDHHFNPFLEKGGGMLGAQWRPPFFFELLALSWTLLGNSLFVSHSIVILFSFLGVLFTYLLGELLFNSRVGIISSLLLFFSPLYFAQSGILNYAVPLTALSMMTVYFALKENVKGYLICASCLVLTKETGILILFPVLLIVFLRYCKETKLYLRILVYILPLLPYLLWLLACKIYLGSFLYPSHVGNLNLHDPLHLFRTFMSKASQLFSNNYHWLLSLFIIISVKRWIKDFYLEREKSILILGGIAAYLFAFALYSIPLERYLLPVYPLFYILFSRSIDAFFKENWKPLFVTFLLVASLFIVNWKGNRSGFGFKFETNLEYLDFIEVHQKAAKFIEEDFPDKHVLTDWPQTMELRHPFEGYVTKPIRASGILEEYDLSDIDLVYFSPQSSRREFLDLRNKLKPDLVLLSRFEKNGKATEVYKLLHQD